MPAAASHMMGKQREMSEISGLPTHDELSCRDLDYLDDLCHHYYYYYRHTTTMASRRSTRRSIASSAAGRTSATASSGRVTGHDEVDGAAAAAVAGTPTTQGRNEAGTGHGEGGEGGDGGDGQEPGVDALLEQVEDCGKNLRGQNRDRFRRGLGGLRRELSASAGRVRRLAADNGSLSAENLSLSERVRALEARLAACRPACSESDGNQSGNDATDGIGIGIDIDIGLVDESSGAIKGDAKVEAGRAAGAAAAAAMAMTSGAAEQNPEAAALASTKSAKGGAKSVGAVIVEEMKAAASASASLSPSVATSPSPSSATKKSAKGGAKDVGVDIMKKKKAENGDDVASDSGAAASASNTSARSVSFQNVHVRENRREISHSTVPKEGTWPLGISNEVVREYDAGSVDVIEKCRQVELKKRYLEVLEQRRERLEKKKTMGAEDVVGTSSDVHVHPLSEDETLETRPFDYKSADKVKKRHRWLRRASSNVEAKEPAGIMDELDDGKNPLLRTLCEEEQKHLMLRDFEVGAEFESWPSPSPSGSSDQYHYRSPSQQEAFSTRTSSRRSTRSNNNAADDLNDKSNDYYAEKHGLDFPSDLDQLRKNQSIESGNLGCTCSKLKTRNLKGKRVKEELSRRGLLHGDALKMNSQEMARLLHDAVEQEVCCTDEGCSCVQNGIGCQADTCPCWEDHNKKTIGTVKELWAHPAEMKRRCGNRNGLYVWDYAAVGDHYKEKIGGGGEKVKGVDGVLLCMPVQKSDD